ncbi:aspartate kinase [Xanthobacter autotrophicus]|uniref:amino acid kinase family protein n=1 Tax=Xanthobacter TaxID=279 RepID=UPI0024AAD930|nr:aspartate kinase [Xanthobacter autotrophicus]MDI4664171.1 aspartate kinase [Xanthobacter autotrophicus]
MTIIVKIGGSLTRDAAPRRLLARLAAEGGLVVVPGGGALADQVRAVQPQWDLSDAAAHRMALLSMEQMAHAMRDLEPRLLPARDRAELAAAVARGAALWFPAAMTLGRPDIAESWDVTSDSLALWLAAEMGAERLVLVKAPGTRIPAPLPAPSGGRAADIAAWTAMGLVDAAFATMAVRFTGDILAIPADDGDRLDAALRAKGRAAAINEETKEGSRLS